MHVGICLETMMQWNMVDQHGARSIERQKTLTAIMVTAVRKVTAIVEATDMLVRVGGGLM